MNQPGHVSVDPEAEFVRVAGEGASWRLVGLLLQRPHSGWWQETEALSGEVQYPRLRDISASVRDATEGAYLSVFGPGGAVSPREVAYRPKKDPGKIMADISGIYRAFAFRPKDEDPVDHICVEANFAGFLCLKEAYALAEDNSEAAEIISGGLRSFLIDHLEPFVQALSGCLKDVEPRYLAESVSCLLELVRRRIGDSTSE